MDSGIEIGKHDKKGYTHIKYKLVEELEVSQTHCIKCVEYDPSDHYEVAVTRQSNLGNRKHTSDLQVQAIFGCSFDHPLHEWPVRIHHNQIVETTQSIDPIGSDGLPPEIALGLAQDLSEAAKCYNFGLYKGAVVIARRACQLSFEDKIPGLDLNRRWTLGLLIDEARKTNPTVLSSTGFSHADIVLEFGNIGAHSEELIDREDARTVIRAAVRVVSDLAVLQSNNQN
ncbi:MAG: DUF4145 domain-containing protein [Chloroflexi bacterium]|nr:DUF4145 domain-containing protein [Chloroflexota bacterium]